MAEIISQAPGGLHGQAGTAGPEGVVVHCEGINISDNFYRNQLKYVALPLPRPQPHLSSDRDCVGPATLQDEASQATPESLKVFDGIPPPTSKSGRWFLLPSMLCF